MRRLFLFSILVCFTVSLLSSPVFSLDSVTPGEIYTDSTLNHISLRWQISDDDDLDSVCSVRYRLAGTSSWKEGMDLFRTYPGLNGEGGDRPDNRFAGSVFFINSGSSYEVEFTLTDPDGGGSVQTVTVTAASELSPPASPIHRYVIPGSGGGSGTQADPFKGLQEACDNARPGDIINVAAGEYDAFTLSTSGEEGNPIVFRGSVNPHENSTESQWSIVEGNNTDRGVFTFGDYNIQTAYIIVENMVLQNGRWGIDAQNSHHILVKNNIIRDVGFGYYNRRENGLDGYQMLSDNTITGRTSWPGSGIPSEQGIDLRGTGNIVCYNRVKNFGDGISVQPFTSAYGYSNDIYGNDISEIVDDPIEIDYNSCNTRVWRNRVINGRMGISLAPIYGGPVYIFRNEFLNLETSAYKMQREAAGLVIIHNTSAKLGNGTSSDAGWQNTYLRNNVIIGTRYVIEEYGLVAGSTDSWDYDALGTTDTQFVKWDNIRYQTISELQAGSGIEAHSVLISLNDLMNTSLPSHYSDGILHGSYDMSLKSGAAAINAGEALPNINDPFVTDGMPDCGAFEYGKTMPEYGPRVSSTPDTDRGQETPSTPDSGGSSGGSGCFIDGSMI